MQQHRIISLASILVMLIIPVIGWFLVAQPQLAAASLADQQRADMDVQIQASTAVVAQLKADSAKLPDLNDDLNKLRTSIPAGVDSSGYIDGLDALAQLSHVLITKLTVGDPTAYVPAVPPVDPAAAAAVAEAAETAGPDGATPPPVAPVVTDPAIVTNPLIDSTSLVAIPVTVDVTGPFESVLAFVDGLQSSPRLFLVTKLNTSVVAGTSDFTGSVTGVIYAIPTGVEGKPRPISTTVKSLTAIVVEAPVEETDPGTDENADPTPEDPADTTTP
ncbi:MAG: hypothetical protein ABI566_14415 [Pseudolysinimonas sp.]